METHTKINNEIYHSLGERWYSAFDDPVALLRAQSELLAPWIIQKIGSPSCCTILDIGCGGGFMSNRFAKAGFDVDAIDLSEDSLAIARKHDSTGKVRYTLADGYHLPFSDRAFRVVTAMDFLEHVEDPKAIIAEVSRVLAPGGLFFFHTFNRNFLSRIVVIKMVELLVANTPDHLHIYRLFIKPSELRDYCHSHDLSIIEMSGVRPKLSTLSIGDIFRRTVPKGFQFELSPSLQISYLGYAKKEEHRL
mgnify:FL=1